MTEEVAAWGGHPFPSCGLEFWWWDGREEMILYPGDPGNSHLCGTCQSVMLLGNRSLSVTSLGGGGVGRGGGLGLAPHTQKHTGNLFLFNPDDGASARRIQ